MKKFWIFMSKLKKTFKKSYKMIVVPHLEWHIPHSCNLSRESCIHFTNHGHNEKYQ